MLMLVESYGLMIIWAACIVVGWYQGKQKISQNTENYEIKSLFDYLMGN